MLKKLRGKIIQVNKDNLSIEVGPVTLEGFPSYRIINTLNEGEVYNFETSFEMSEFSMSLFFFLDDLEKKVFTNLKKVSKIGPKTAAKITNTSDAEAVASMIASQDIAGLSKLPGIGKKTAERIISELKGEFDAIEVNASDSTVSDAIDALEALGYERYKVIKLLKSIDTKNMKTEEIIKIGLANLS